MKYLINILADPLVNLIEAHRYVFVMGGLLCGWVSFAWILFYCTWNFVIVVKEHWKK